MNSFQRKFRTAALMGAAASVLVFASAAMAQNHDDDHGNSSKSDDNAWPYAKVGKSPVLAVVGDIACQPGETTPTGEANHELCFNPKAPYTANSLWLSQEATANQIEAMKPAAVAIVGDLQYQVGESSDFENSFDLTYGAFKFLHRPAPGNHEVYDEHSQTGVAGYGYFSYYNGFKIDAYGKPITTTITDPCPPANASICNYPGLTTPVPQPTPRANGQAGPFGATGNGWYSYNLGSWHLISLNIECGTQPGGCSDSGAWLASELAWLKSDLEANHAACTVAYWHQPTFSAADSLSTEGKTADAFWQLLYDAGADLVLNGHDHLYARYRPLDPAGNYDPKKGIREFIVGTGGETLDAVSASTASTATPGAQFNAANLENSSGDFWGVMGLTLNHDGYAWDFESALKGTASTSSAASFSDKGVAACHGPANGYGDDDHDR